LKLIQIMASNGKYMPVNSLIFILLSPCAYNRSICRSLLMFIFLLAIIPLLNIKSNSKDYNLFFNMRKTLFRWSDCPAFVPMGHFQFSVNPHDSFMVPFQSFFSDAMIILRKSPGRKFFSIIPELFLNLRIIFYRFVIIHGPVKFNDPVCPCN
jgi:hypothetical protein